MVLTAAARNAKAVSPVIGQTGTGLRAAHVVKACDMQMRTTFTRHPDFRIVTAQIPEGVRTLLRAVDGGLSVHARQTGPAVSAEAGDRQWIMCETSGTSGPRKTIRRSAASWIRSFDLARTLFSAGPADIYATLGTLGHSLTLFATLEAVHLGAALCPLTQPGPRRQARELAGAGVSVIYATPTQLSMLASGAGAQGLARFPSVRLVLVGGGMLAATQRDQLAALFPAARIVVFFGASETSFITMTDAGAPADSVGRAYPGVEIRIDAAPGEAGEIWVSSPYLFDGYASGGSDLTRWRDGFLSIGEIGYRDAGGYLFLKGRRNRMVTVADRNVFPEEIEAVIAGIAGVQSCAAIAVPDDRRGHAILCFVQAQGALSEADLRRACRAALGVQSVPRRFLFLPRMPLLPSGKPDLERLRADLPGAG